MIRINLSIIIVNYKTPSLTLRCLDSIFQFSIKDIEVIVVDNNSKDTSISEIKSNFPQVKLIESPENIGFGRANNLGLEKAKGKYILFLNSDMVLKQDTLSTCLHIIKKDNKIGVLACLQLNEDNTIQKSKYYHTADFIDILKTNIFLDKVYKFKDGKLKAVMGSFMMIPKNILDELGSFHPSFFMYSEELELCNRISKAGYAIHFTDKTSAIHKHGGSTTDKPWSVLQKTVSNQLFYRIKHGALGFLMYHILTVFNFVSNFLFIWYFDTNFRKNYFKSFKTYIKTLKYFFVILFYKTSLSNRNKYLKVN